MADGKRRPGIWERLFGRQDPGPQAREAPEARPACSAPVNPVFEKAEEKAAHVDIPYGVEIIGERAFEDCTLTLKSVTIPASVREIRERAFYECLCLREVRIPEGVQVIGAYAFAYCNQLKHVEIPGSVREIGEGAFSPCRSLTSVRIHNGVSSLGKKAFTSCTQLTDVVIGDSVEKIGNGAFARCGKLRSVTLPGSLAEIGYGAFRDCIDLRSIVIPEGVAGIGTEAFAGCKALDTVEIKNGLTRIGDCAFQKCGSLKDVYLPESVTQIGDMAFEECARLRSVTIRGKTERLGRWTFSKCPGLTLVRLLADTENIEYSAFSHSDAVTVVCPEESFASRRCRDLGVPFLYDYQFEAFHGVIPAGIEKLASPFLADEEKPYVFISYSHKDRDAVLPVIKALYESGWRIWYDEGLTIGDRYDETLEEHVRGCSAVVLFMTENSMKSRYILDNEIPWAVGCGKRIVKCVLGEGADLPVPAGSVAALVPPEGIGAALEGIDGLFRGEPRTAKGISVVFDPAARSDDTGSGFAYGLYAPGSAAAARSILLEARNNGCALYDAAAIGAEEEKLSSAACLVVFLDREYLSDRYLMKILADVFRTERDLAVCQIGEFRDEELPPELEGLRLVQWLDYVHGIRGDMDMKLARHLQKRGCRDSAVLPGLEYDRTDRGLVIRKYTGRDAKLRIENEYGGVPVVGIADSAFALSQSLKEIVISGGVRSIGASAFKGCVALTSAVIENGVEEIGEDAFKNCRNLASLTLPGSLRTVRRWVSGCGKLASVVIGPGTVEIGDWAFHDCPRLRETVIPDSVTAIGYAAFQYCKNLESLSLPGSVAHIDRNAFGFSGLTSVTVPAGVKLLSGCAFEGCRWLHSVILEDGVREIGNLAFLDCEKLRTVMIPGSVEKIAEDVFSLSPPPIDEQILLEDMTDEDLAPREYIPYRSVTVTCPADSYAHRYCAEKGIPVVLQDI